MTGLCKKIQRPAGEVVGWAATDLAPNRDHISASIHSEKKI